MRVYVAGKMQGLPDFGFPAFADAAVRLRALGHEVFSPAERDIALHGAAVYKSATGDLADIAGSGFSLRDALAADTAWICLQAEGIALLPGWEGSKGATAERALGLALGLRVEPLEVWLATTA